MELVQTAFRDGDLAEEATWQAVVLIPKGKKDYQGIGLMEVMWKVVAVILNQCFTSSITYHDALHGFRAGRGIGTATLEDKLLQQLVALREEVLYVIFLDLHKAYDTLDRSRCLEILEGYGIGLQAIKIPKTYWHRLTMVARAGGLLRDSFKGGERRDAGRPAVSHNFQCGGGRGRPTLGTRSSGRSGSTGRNRTGGPASGRCRFFLCAVPITA